MQDALDEFYCETLMDFLMENVTSCDSDSSIVVSGVEPTILVSAGDSMPLLAAGTGGALAVTAAGAVPLPRKNGTRGSNVEPAMAAAGGSSPPLATGSDDAPALTATGDIHLPSDILEIVKDLQAKKQLSIADEDYKAAEFFKNAAEMVTTTGVEIAEIRVRKDKAVKDEDYTMADEMKQAEALCRSKIADGVVTPPTPNVEQINLEHSSGRTAQIVTTPHRVCGPATQHLAPAPASATGIVEMVEVEVVQDMEVQAPPASLAFEEDGDEGQAAVRIGTRIGEDNHAAVNHAAIIIQSLFRSRYTARKELNHLRALRVERDLHLETEAATRTLALGLLARTSRPQSPSKPSKGGEEYPQIFKLSVTH